MTAKTRHGKGAHHKAHGADPGTPHERLNRMHAQPGRPEGAMMQQPSAEPPPQPMPAAPPGGMGIGGGMSPPGAGPDTDEGEQT